MIFLLVIGFLLFGFILQKSPEESIQITCGDGTSYGNCSDNLPYFCDNGTLVPLPKKCGCPSEFNIENNSCVSEYEKNPKEVSFNYTLRGNNSEINLKVYEKVKNYTKDISREMTFDSDENYSLRNFKVKAINDSIQNFYLTPLVIKIQNLFPNNKKDQIRTAVSLVQNIPYEASKEKSSSTFFKDKVNHSRYPYEVVYENKGICGEKSQLLVFLLKEFGYETAIFSFPDYNHEAVGVKCPSKYSFKDTGFCLIETTRPSIISSKFFLFEEFGKTETSPEVYKISSGISLPKEMYDYDDAESFDKIQESIQKDGMLSSNEKNKLEKLRKKYGLTF